MFSGTVFLALVWLAGIAPSAAALAGEQQQAIVHTQIAPVESQHHTPPPCEPSAFEEEQEDDTRRCSQGWPGDPVLTSASCGGALSSWLVAPRGEPMAEGLRFATSLGMARGPPASL